MTVTTTLSDDILQQLIPIDRLSQQQRALLFAHAELQSRRRGTDLLAEVAEGRDILYLIEGRVDLNDPDRGRIRIEAGSSAARLPLIPSQPLPESATAATAITLLRCNRAWLDALLLPPLLLPFCHSHEAADTEPSDWLQQLMQTRLFQRLPAPFTQQLFSRADPMAYAAGQTVIRQGQLDSCFYLIQSGSCEVMQTDSNGRVIHTLAELGPGSWFGEVPILSGTPSSVTVNMRREGALLRIDRSSFIDLVRASLVETIDFNTACARAETGASWLDIRESGEFDSQHLPGAVNCSLSEILANRTALKLDQHYIVYCDSGARSIVAAWLLALSGYTVSWLYDATTATDALTDAVSDSSSMQAEPLLDVLRSELTRLLQQVDNAVRIKHEAEVARREAEQAARARLDEESLYLDRQARHVRAMLTQTQQLQQRLVEEKDRLYAGLRRRERAVEDRINNLNDYIEKRVAQERERLESHYRARETEIHQLQQEKAVAESRLQSLQGGHTTRKEDNDALPISDDRQALEQEFEQYSQALQAADQERAETRATRSAVTTQAEELLAELGHAPAHIQASRQRLQREREQLESSARELSAQVEQTLLDKQATHAVQEALQHEAEQLQQRSKDSGLVDDEALESARTQAEAATDRYNQAEQAHTAALAAKQKNETALAETEKAEQKLVQELNAEIEVWLTEEASRPRSPKQETLIKNYEETMQRMQEEAAAAEENERTHDHLLLSEINAALEDIAAGRTKQGN